MESNHVDPALEGTPADLTESNHVEQLTDASLQSVENTQGQSSEITDTSEEHIPQDGELGQAIQDPTEEVAGNEVGEVDAIPEELSYENQTVADGTDELQDTVQTVESPVELDQPQPEESTLLGNSEPIVEEEPQSNGGDDTVDETSNEVAPENQEGDQEGEGERESIANELMVENQEHTPEQLDIDADVQRVDTDASPDSSTTELGAAADGETQSVVEAESEVHTAQEETNIIPDSPNAESETSAEIDHIQEEDPQITEVEDETQSDVQAESEVQMALEETNVILDSPNEESEISAEIEHKQEEDPQNTEVEDATQSAVQEESKVIIEQEETSVTQDSPPPQSEVPADVEDAEKVDVPIDGEAADESQLPNSESQDGSSLKTADELTEEPKEPEETVHIDSLESPLNPTTEEVTDDISEFEIIDPASVPQEPSHIKPDDDPVEQKLDETIAPGMFTFPETDEVVGKEVPTPAIVQHEENEEAPIPVEQVTEFESDGSGGHTPLLSDVPNTPSDQGVATTEPDLSINYTPTIVQPEELNEVEHITVSVEPPVSSEPEPMLEEQVDQKLEMTVSSSPSSVRNDLHQATLDNDNIEMEHTQSIEAMPSTVDPIEKTIPTDMEMVNGFHNELDDQSDKENDQDGHRPRSPTRRQSGDSPMTTEDIKLRSRTLEPHGRSSVDWLDSTRRRAATLGRSESRRRPKLQPKPAPNDDHMFPDSVTPSKVDRGLSVRSLSDGLPGGTYDVPYIDDDAFLPKRLRENGEGSEHSSDIADWYWQPDSVLKQQLDPAHIADTNECLPTPKLMPVFKSAPSRDSKDQLIQDNASGKGKKKRRRFRLCGCMGRQRQS